MVNYQNILSNLQQAPQFLKFKDRFGRSWDTRKAIYHVNNDNKGLSPNGLGLYYY